MQTDKLVSRRYSAASNSQKGSGGKMQVNLFRNWTKPVTLIILNKAEATHPSKLHLGIYEQLQCFTWSIDKLTSIPKQVVKSTKKWKRERNRKKRNTRNEMK